MTHQTWSSSRVLEISWFQDQLFEWSQKLLTFVDGFDYQKNRIGQHYDQKCHDASPVELVFMRSHFPAEITEEWFLNQTILQSSIDISFSNLIGLNRNYGLVTKEPAIHKGAQFWFVETQEKMKLF